MADVRTVFPILDDDGNGAGGLPRKRQEGEAGAAQNGLIGFSFKDNSGNVILPQLNSDGTIPVSDPNVGAAGTCFDNTGIATGNNSTEQTVAEVTVSAAEVYTQFEWSAHCFRDAVFRLVYIDDADGTPAETTLAYAMVGPGSMNFLGSYGCLELDTTGGTGTQKIAIKAINDNAPSDFRATLTFLEKG